MKYFITESERNGTCYHEWSKGHFDETVCWKCDSLLLSDDILFSLGLERVFLTFLPEYDPFGETEVTEKTWDAIMGRARETGGALWECLQEADNWARRAFQEYGVFTMIGI